MATRSLAASHGRRQSPEDKKHAGSARVRSPRSGVPKNRAKASAFARLEQLRDGAQVVDERAEVQFTFLGLASEDRRRMDGCTDGLRQLGLKQLAAVLRDAKLMPQ